MGSQPVKYVLAHTIGTATPVSVDNAASRPDWWDSNIANNSGPYQGNYNSDLIDRPIWRPQRTPSNWMTLDYQDRLAKIKAAGFDGAFMDMLSIAPHPARQLLIMDGAALAGVKIVPQPDTNSWNGNITAANGFTTETSIINEAARRLGLLFGKPAWFRLADGRYLISPYHAELWTAARWLNILTTFEATNHVSTAILVNFASAPSSTLSSWQTTLGARMIGAGIWGGRSPATVTSGASQAATAHGLGLDWCQFTACQDNRRREALFDEAANTQLLRDTWGQAITGDADWVMHPTLDDYYESSQLEPTQTRGDGWVWLSSYYVSWFKTGTAPSIVRDTVFLSHRLMPWNATPTGQNLSTMPMMKLRSGSTPAQDKVEALCFLTAPATVTLDGQSFSGAPGLNVFTVNLSARTHTATVVRGGSTVVSVSSAAPSQATLPAQNLDYVIASNVSDATWHTDITPVTGLAANFEAGTTGATVTTSDTASSAAFDAVTTTSGGTLAYDTTHSAHGSKALKVATGTTLGASSVKWRTQLTSPASAGPFYARIYLYVTSLATQPVPISFMNGNFANLVGVRVTTGGQLAVLVNGTAADHTTTSVIPLNQWFRVELKAVADATNGSYEMRYYSTPDATTPTETVANSGIATAQSGQLIDTVAFGSTQQLANVPALWVDDVAASAVGWPGPAVATAATAAGAVSLTGHASGSNVPLNTAAGSISLTGASGYTASIPGHSVTENFESGTNGATISPTDPASPNQFDAVGSQTGSVLVYDTTHSAHGSKAGKFTTTALAYSSVKWQASLTGGTPAAGPFWARAYVYVTGATTQPVVLAFMNGAFTNIVGIRLTTTQKISVIVNGTTVDWTSTTTFPLNAWFRVELEAVGATSTGSYTVRLYNTADAPIGSETETHTNSSVNTGGTIDTVAYGITQQLNTPPALWVDDVAASDITWPGPAVQAATPNAGQLTLTGDAGVVAGPIGSAAGAISLSGNSTTAMTPLVSHGRTGVLLNSSGATLAELADSGKRTAVLVDSGRRSAPLVDSGQRKATVT